MLPVVAHSFLSRRAIDQEVTLCGFLSTPTYHCSNLRNECFNNIGGYSSHLVLKIFREDSGFILAIQLFQSLATQILREYFLTSSLTLCFDVIMKLSCNGEVPRGNHVIYCSSLDNRDTLKIGTLLQLY